MKRSIRLASVVLLFLYASAFGALKDAVVRIEAGGRCSGVCVDADGYILTAEHCLTSFNKDIWVYFGEKKFRATVVYKPPINITDEAGLLKVESPYPLPYATVSRRSPVKGDKVHSIGYPKGKFATASGEVVSVSQTHSPPTAYVINVNFNEARGNSGGPLFNDNDEVVGLSSTSGLSGSQWIGLESIHKAMEFTHNSKPVLYAYAPGST